MTNHRISTAGTKALRVMKALGGHSLEGLTNVELAKSLDETASSINRSLETLIHEGIAEKLSNGKFALSVQILGLAHRHAAEIEPAKQSIEDLQGRIAASVNQYN